MQISENTDILIVGQGLAGTLLSHQLYKHNIKHKVIDTPLEGSASRAAAGLINPIAVKRVTKTWRADTFQPYADTLYRELEEKLQTRFYYPIPINKLYGKDDAQFWQHRLLKNELDDYITVNPSTSISENIHQPYQFGTIKKSARLDMATLLYSYRDFLKAQGNLIEAYFKDDDIKLNKDGIEWQNIKARRIIFCRGSFDAQSSFFKHLKWDNTKGELLNVELENLKLNTIISKGVFVMPLGDKQFKIGATYSHKWEDLNPTEEKKQELIEKWSVISDLPLTITKQITGIRPTFADRRPVNTILENNPAIGIFNGLGSRGGLMAPYLAKEMVELIV